MTANTVDSARRRYALATAGALFGVPLWTQAHQGAGIVRPPQSLPPLQVTPVRGGAQSDGRDAGAAHYRRPAHVYRL